MGERLLAFTLILCLVVIAVPKGTQGYLWPRHDTYTTRWDKVNVDDILESKRLLHYYFNCLMNKGPCPPDGHELKRVLPEALQTACAKCTKSQIEGSVKVIRYLRQFEPGKFKQLAERYDPEGMYRKRYLEQSLDNNTA
ncbi:ejaculatory bulb-specific protein 3 [Cephus cinctus]|uniref:Chemosensory protein 6 n=1 Tax=Cephus cinctus TaxID=211228 RepID=A0A1W6L129_CEPCN|nr:ejaculatory bulb-specific protein 3 [Cephus cinctus]ARN17837.1 chemosensory protein 6 [Cephus cinctus]